MEETADALRGCGVDEEMASALPGDRMKKRLMRGPWWQGREMACALTGDNGGVDEEMASALLGDTWSYG